MLTTCSSKLIFVSSLIKLHSGSTARSVKPALSICCGGLSLRFAGHSKWQNIKHTKADKDRIKGQKYNHHIFEITTACTNAKSSLDPKSNPALAKAIENAKAANVASATIKRCLDRLALRRKNPETVKFSYRGPEGVIAVVACITDNVARTKGDLNKLFKKHNFVKGDAGIVSLFYGKGFVQAKPPPNMENFSDKYLEDAIEVDAEEVNPDENNPDILNFTCDVNELPKVKSKLEAKNYVIITAEEEFIPHCPTSASNELMEAIQKLAEEVEELGEVEKLYFNLE